MPDDQHDDLLLAAGLSTPDQVKDIAMGAGKTLGKSAAELLGLPDAMRALRGEMDPEEAKHFAMTAALGLIPGGKMENMLTKGAAKMAGASMGKGNLIAQMALKGDVPGYHGGQGFTNAAWHVGGGNMSEGEMEGKQLEHALNMLQEPARPSLSEKSIKNALQENPGASIFDVAGVKEPKTGGIAYEGDEVPIRNREDLVKHLKPLDWENWRGHGGPADFEDLSTRERARQLGFNVENVLYKGGRHEEYPSQISDRFMKKDTEPGLFLGDTRHVGDQYGNATLPYVARSENPLMVDWKQATGFSGYDSRYMDPLVRAAKEKGSDLLVIKGVDDLGGKQNQYVVLKPNILRAPEAEFNPSRLHEAAPLAGVGGLVAGGAAGTGLFFDEQGNPLIQQR